MKYAEIARTALALSLGMMMSTALADVVYTETFEDVSTTNYHPIVLKDRWTGGAEDNSRVVTNTYAPPAGGYPVLSTTHTNVLQLNTEGGTLTNTITDGVSFKTTAAYVDSMVKFVPSDALQTFDDDGIKVAVYAYIQEVGESSTTNLAVYHGAYNKLGVPSYWATNTVTDLLVSSADWYRLTIVLANGSGDTTHQAFKIFINGVPITNAAAYKDDWNTVVNTSPGTANLGPWFLSAGNQPTDPQEDEATTISYLQFKGTGFVDDLVVGAGDPFEQGEPPAAPFGITQDIGAGGSGNAGSGLIIVPAGTTTSVTYSAADFYVINSLTTNTTPVSGAAGAKQAEVTFDATNDVVATFAVASAYASAPVDWFKANGWGEGDIVENPNFSYDTLELLNVAATNTAAGGTITIEEIEVVGDDVKVTVFIDRTMSLGAGISGNLVLYGATTLEGGFTEIDSVVIGDDLDGSQDDIRKVVTYAMAGGKKFYKAVIEPGT